MNNITIKGKKYRAALGKCTDCVFFPLDSPIHCTQHPKTQCVGILRKDGRNIMWVAVKHKEKQNELVQTPIHN
jgi:predicted Fe-S protein YdhL (DUF1289 family)